MLAALLSLYGWVVWVVVGCGCVWAGWWSLLRPTLPPAHLSRFYARPTFLYPLKVIVFYCLVKFRKSRDGEADGAGYGAKSYRRVEEMERSQPLCKGPKAIDAVFFSGAGGRGWGLVVAMERRPRTLTSTLIYLKVPGQGLLVRPTHPDTVTFRRTQDEDRFCAGDLTITPSNPMTTWTIHYKGKLKVYKPEAESKGEGEAQEAESMAEEVAAEFELRWVTQLPHFDYDTDLPPLTTAKAFAREPWNREFFTHLRQHHQTHYEQMGQLVGTITLDGITHSIYLPAFRDHSYGREREWRLMHRYVFHHIFLEDGSRGVVGVVCQPSTCSRLEVGHWWSGYGDGCSVSDVGLQLHQHGENGTPPTDYAFTFTAGGVERLVEVEVDEAPQHYLGWDWEARMVETFVRYRVDGVPGSGICEWHYRNRTGRPSKLNDRDPISMKDYRSQYLAAGFGGI